MHHLLLMCKNTPVYDIDTQVVLNKALLPGAIKHQTMTYEQWMKTRYSTGSNTPARRMALRAFGSDNHNTSLHITRALSLTDSYWLKNENETICFEEVTPYLNKEWDGTGDFKGGSIATLFVNGAAHKQWLNETWLKKLSCSEEYFVVDIANKLGVLPVVDIQLDDNKKDIRVKNFTNINVFFESAEQSGLVGGFDVPIKKWIDLYGQDFVKLVLLDHLVENDDRHWGNFGHLRDANTGEILGLSPHYDFDWAFKDGTIPLSDVVYQKYGDIVEDLTNKALELSRDYPDPLIAGKLAYRGKELKDILDGNR